MFITIDLNDIMDNITELENLIRYNLNIGNQTATYSLVKSITKSTILSVVCMYIQKEKFSIPVEVILSSDMSIEALRPIVYNSIIELLDNALDGITFQRSGVDIVFVDGILLSDCILMVNIEYVTNK